VIVTGEGGMAGIMVHDADDSQATHEENEISTDIVVVINRESNQLKSAKEAVLTIGANLTILIN
jgi:hypothetical protein